MILKETMPHMSLAFVAAAEGDQPSRQADFAAGRLAATQALQALTGSGCPFIGRAGHGKPFGRLNERCIGLSISHLDGFAASVATTAGCAVGIDLVRANSVAAAELRFFMSARERSQACVCDPAVLWALKEAAWKALGGMRAVPFKDLELTLDAAGGLTGLRWGRNARAGRSFVLAPWPGFHAAVVWLPEAA